jgi:hypothetical protein
MNWATYTSFRPIDNQRMIVRDTHGVHGSSKEFLWWHHVRKTLGIEFWTFGTDVINIKELCTSDARTGLVFVPSDPNLAQKPGSVDELDCGVTVCVKGILERYAGFPRQRIRRGTRHVC